MSTATTQLSFAEASVRKLPTLACVGYVDEVGEGKISESKTYVVQPIKLRAHTPGRNANTNFLYRPEWIDPNFEIDSLTELGEEGEKMLTVYRRNIAVKDGISALKGLAGSDAAFDRVANALLSMTPAAKEDPIQVSAVLRDNLQSDADGVTIGYILRQRRDAVGEDENGKKIYELANGYEVQDYFFPTAQKLKQLRQRAANAKDGSFQIAFDQE